MLSREGLSAAGPDVARKAFFLQEGGESGDYEEGTRLPKRPRWRLFKFGASTQPHHCSLCGYTHHNIGTCVAGSSSLRMKMLYQKERLRKSVASFFTVEPVRNGHGSAAEQSL